MDPEGYSSRRLASPYLGLSGLILTAAAIGYGFILARQGDWPHLNGRETFVLSLLVALAVMSFLGTFARLDSARAAIAAACVATLMPLGFLALFSIGFVLVAAGGLALAAWADAAADPAQRRVMFAVWAASAAVAIAVVAAGFVATA